MDAPLEMRINYPIGFGSITASGARSSNDFTLSVEYEPKGWVGSSSLVATAMMPMMSFIDKSVLDSAVELAFQIDPSGPKEYPDGVIYATKFSTSNVCLSRYPPNISGIRQTWKVNEQSARQWHPSWSPERIAEREEEGASDSRTEKNELQCITEIATPAKMATRPELLFPMKLSSTYVITATQKWNPHSVFGMRCGNGHPQVFVFAKTIRMGLSNQGVFVDAAVLPLDDNFMDSKHADLLDSALFNNPAGVGVIPLDEAELNLWKHALPMFAERVRSTHWKHQALCEYVKAGSIPISTKPGKPFLCSCGARKSFLPGSFAGSPRWKAISRHATRVAIAPLYKSPLANTESKLRSAAMPLECAICGRRTAKGGGKLL
ncbi:hypothetical protein BU23DRAFT_570543 [Bimuria novae-zelandiae CBS 107.79]|uniref:Uncharacterized protein n=1 Tax=Bimuria novae-zelandiae CBS 107.79 TaxID=1447943 RepID=A0A6A5V161_9PLEO|nr:hypothetical protein BU23DRAFT_570543 [Bimuria novae-zelandiae CBS 107.79]